MAGCRAMTAQWRGDREYMPAAELLAAIEAGLPDTIRDVPEL